MSNLHRAELTALRDELVARWIELVDISLRLGKFEVSAMTGGGISEKAALMPPRANSASTRTKHTATGRVKPALRARSRKSPA